MKKFILKSLFASVFSLIISFAGIFVYGNINYLLKTSYLKYPIGGYGHTYSRLSEVENIKNIDILFLGSSHTYRGFDPRIFKKYGYNIFNLGTSSQTPIQSKLLLKKHIHRLNPKIIFFDVYHVTSSIDGVESSLDIVSNTKNLSFYEFKHLFELNDLELFKTFLFSLLNNIFQENFKEKISKTNYSDKYIAGGFVEKSPSNKYNDQLEFPEISINKISKKQLGAIDDIINISKSHNTKIILVNTPLKKLYNSSYQFNNYFDSLMNSKSEYINFNKLNLMLNDTIHFYGKDHLSQLGVQEFNKFFIEKKLDSIKP